ncbi:hypothetical protein BDW60DRAFT_50154 [Aspergillus nidulans var. acristatus]
MLAQWGPIRMRCLVLKTGCEFPAWWATPLIVWSRNHGWGDRDQHDQVWKMNPAFGQPEPKKKTQNRVDSTIRMIDAFVVFWILSSTLYFATVSLISTSLIIECIIPCTADHDD